MTRAGKAGPLLAVGVDPGPVTGIAWCRDPASGWPPVHALQCDHGAFAVIVRALLAAQGGAGTTVVIQAERFVTGNLPGSRGASADITRAAFEEARAVAREHEAAFFAENAAAAKAWATDKRLTAVGFPVHVGAHARDAGRHLLRVSVAHCGARDPLTAQAPATMRELAA